MASEVAKRLRDRRLSVWNEARGLAEEATNQNRAFTPEEQGKWDALNEEIDKLDERIKAVLETEKRGKDADAAFDELSGKKPDKDAERKSKGTGGMSEEARAFFTGKQGAPRHFDVNPDGPVNYRVLSTLTLGAGGDLEPTDFYDQLIAHLIEVSGIMQAGPTVLNTAGGEPLQVPKTVTHPLGAAVAQAGPIPSADPTFGMETLRSYKYGVLLQVARELLDDTGVDLIGYLSMAAGRAIGNSFGAALVTGTGTNEPTGILTSATVGVTGSTGHGGAPQYADLIDLEYSVIAPYRQSRSCYWMAADQTIAGFRKLVDANGRPIWEPSTVLGTPDMLLGKPLVADPFMPAVATGASSVAFGDFAQFFVRLVGGVRFERSDDFAFGNDLTTFRALIRGDGLLVDTTGAIKLLQGAAS
jgi:HK97 family phage major capsid protein